MAEINQTEEKLITVMIFDGWREISNDKGQYLRPKNFGPASPLALSQKHILEYVGYQTSWDWLHPVWEKFRDMQMYDPNDWLIHWNHCQKIKKAITDYNSPTEAYTALYEAITFLNNKR